MGTRIHYKFHTAKIRNNLIGKMVDENYKM
jgi:hypothetical protein